MVPVRDEVRHPRAVILWFLERPALLAGRIRIGVVGR